MSIDALTQAADGRPVIPASSQDWQDWVSAGSTRNWVLNDPLLDWLNLYGERHGFQRDNDISGHDPRTDFLAFLFRQGNAFETAVVAHLKTLVSVVTIAKGRDDIRDLNKAEETFVAMQSGEAVIHQGVLRDAETQTYGAPDLLVRSDKLHRLFPSAIAPEAAHLPAPDLGSESWHYRVVDIKFTTLGLLANGQLNNTKSSPAYKAQIFVYNRALGRLQGYLPGEGYVLGRGWNQKVKGQPPRGTTCMERLAPVPQDYSYRSGQSLAETVQMATDWILRVRREGSDWVALPEPSIDELRPNMGNDEDAPWHVAKGRIGQELSELTLLWEVGVEKRRGANEAGVFRWTDSSCTPHSAGVTGPKQAPTLQAILDVNRSNDGPPIQPDHVHTSEEEWRPEPTVEFYVDFETVQDLNDDFSLIPEKGGQPLIFMIGSGHVEHGKWRYVCFTVDELTEACEATIIDAWFEHMRSVRQQLDPGGEEPRLFHWSHHEPTSFETQYNSATVRHADKNWPTPRWFDFYKRVMTAEPVVVRGALDFGLKAVTKAMHRLGLVETIWEDGPTDGLGAMVGAWSCAAEAAERHCTLSETELMQEIMEYNEVDCKVMMEIVRYLRTHH